MTRMLRPFGLAVLSSLLLAIPACANHADAEDSGAEDELVATFDRTGRIDLTKTTRILLIGDSHHLADLPLWSATTRARRYAELHPDEQIVLFVTKDVSSADLAD